MGSENHVTRLEGTEKENFLHLMKETGDKLVVMGDRVTANRISSRELYDAVKDRFVMEPNYKTGTANIKGFCEKIWQSLPAEFHEFSPENPGKLLAWTTADSKFGNKAARGLKALSSWLKDNVDTLFVIKVEKRVPNPENPEETIVAKDEKGETLYDTHPRFKSIAKEDAGQFKSSVDALSKHIEGIMSSELVPDSFKAQLQPIFEELTKTVISEKNAEAEEAVNKVRAELKLAYSKPAETPTEETGEKKTGTDSK